MGHATSEKDLMNICRYFLKIFPITNWPENLIIFLEALSDRVDSIFVR